MASPDAAFSATDAWASAAEKYRHDKEAFVSDLEGGSVIRINAVSLTALTSYALWAALRSARSPALSRRSGPAPSATSAAVSISLLAVEYGLLILPLLLATTILSSPSGLFLLNALLAGACAAVLWSHKDDIRARTQSARLGQRAKAHQRHGSKDSSSEEDSEEDEREAAEWETGSAAAHARVAMLRESEAASQISSASNGQVEPEVIRVSVDSAADQAHFSAHPPTPYIPPDERDEDEAAGLVDATPSSAAAAATAVPTTPGRAPKLRGTALASSQRSSFESTLETEALLGAGPGNGRLRGSPYPTPERVASPPGAGLGIGLPSRMAPLQTSNLGGTVPNALRSPSSSSSATTSERVASFSLPRPVRPPSSTASRSRAAAQLTPDQLVPPTKPYLTIYRAHMMLMTIICILAVDFKAFPREFAKCESWGSSLMDMGVGSFVFSLGLISASSYLRAPQNRFKPLRGQLVRDVRKALPLVALGMIRVIMVKGVEYPEHVTEYGVHWNFFFTLAVMPLCATVVRPLGKRARWSGIAIALMAAHQLALWLTPLQTWALADIPRKDLITANKEGLASLPGYLAIYFLGLDVGHYVLPNDPYLAYRRPSRSRAQPKTEKLAMVLASLAILWWGAHGILYVVGARISRRLANGSYVVWVTAYNVSFILSYVVVYMVLLEPLALARQARAAAAGTAASPATASPVLRAKSPSSAFDPVKSTADALEEREDSELKKLGFRDGLTSPRILQSINRHSLLIFLVANLLTGLVNLSMQTMYAGNATAVFVLILYTSALVGGAALADARKWALRL